MFNGKHHRFSRLRVKSKASGSKNSRCSHLPTYSETPDFVDLDITEEVVEKIARRLTGSAGLGGTDADVLSH
mgnify:CR=1 FL=1